MKHFHVKRLQRTLDTLHAQLKTWRQSSWMESPNWTRRNDYFGYDREDDADLVKVDTRTCGTAGCLAGWGAIIAGAKFVAHPGEFLELVAPPGRVRAVLSGEEDPRHVRAFAGEYFGLDDHQAHAQFDSENSYARLWALAMLFTGGRLTLPAEVTQDQAEGAREQGSEAYWAENWSLTASRARSCIGTSSNSTIRRPSSRYERLTATSFDLRNVSTVPRAVSSMAARSLRTIALSQASAWAARVRSTAARSCVAGAFAQAASASVNGRWT